MRIIIALLVVFCGVAHARSLTNHAESPLQVSPSQWYGERNLRVDLSTSAHKERDKFGGHVVVPVMDGLGFINLEATYIGQEKLNPEENREPGSPYLDRQGIDFGLHIDRTFTVTAGARSYTTKRPGETAMHAVWQPLFSFAVNNRRFEFGGWSSFRRAVHYQDEDSTFGDEDPKNAFSETEVSPETQVGEEQEPSLSDDTEDEQPVSDFGAHARYRFSVEMAGNLNFQRKLQNWDKATVGCEWMAVPGIQLTLAAGHERSLPDRDKQYNKNSIYTDILYQLGRRVAVGLKTEAFHVNQQESESEVLTSYGGLLVMKL